MKGAIGEQQYSSGLSKNKLQMNCKSPSRPILSKPHEGGVNAQCGVCGHSFNMSENARTGSLEQPVLFKDESTCTVTT